MGLYSAWLTLKPSPSDSDFWKNMKEGWYESHLIGSGLSNHPSSPVKAKMECYKSYDLFAKPPRSCPSALWVTTHGQKRYSFPILQPQLTGQNYLTEYQQLNKNFYKVFSVLLYHAVKQTWSLNLNIGLWNGNEVCYDQL